MRGFAEREVERLVYVHALIRRRRSTGARPVTARADAGRACSYAELRWLLDRQSAAEAIDPQSAVLRTSPDLQVLVTHKPRALSGRLEPAEFRLRTEAPFIEEETCPQWIPLLLSEFDGVRSGSEVLARMRSHRDLDAQLFGAAVRRLLTMGALQPASGSRITSSS
jgi:hypothetical protein